MTGTMILLVSFMWSHLLNVSDKTLHVGPASFNEAAIVETKTNTRIGEGNVLEIWMGRGYKLGTVGLLEPHMFFYLALMNVITWYIIYTYLLYIPIF